MKFLKSEYEKGAIEMWNIGHSKEFLTAAIFSTLPINSESREFEIKMSMQVHLHLFQTLLVTQWLLIPETKFTTSNEMLKLTKPYKSLTEWWMTTRKSPDICNLKILLGLLFITCFFLQHWKRVTWKTGWHVLRKQ